jgi:integrase
MRALQVRDFTEVPMPLLHVVRNQPEGASVKTPKSGKSRNVPIPDYLVPVIRRFTVGKRPSDLLFTSARGAQLHRTQFVRAASWEVTGRGRTLHDLRHTAACEWLIQGVPLTTVQAWLGHGSIQITARYLHHLGDFADRAALDVLNNAASKAFSERARKLPDLGSFGAEPARRSAPDHGRGVGR